MARAGGVGSHTDGGRLAGASPCAVLCVVFLFLLRASACVLCVVCCVVYCLLSARSVCVVCFVACGLCVALRCALCVRRAALVMFIQNYSRFLFFEALEYSKVCRQRSCV